MFKLGGGQAYNCQSAKVSENAYQNKVQLLETTRVTASVYAPYVKSRFTLLETGKTLLLWQNTFTSYVLNHTHISVLTFQLGHSSNVANIPAVISVYQSSLHI
jgi:hypothetical protein